MTETPTEQGDLPMVDMRALPDRVLRKILVSAKPGDLLGLEGCMQRSWIPAHHNRDPNCPSGVACAHRRCVNPDI